VQVQRLEEVPKLARNGDVQLWEVEEEREHMEVGGEEDAPPWDPRGIEGVHADRRGRPRMPHGPP